MERKVEAAGRFFSDLFVSGNPGARDSSSSSSSSPEGRHEAELEETQEKFLVHIARHKPPPVSAAEAPPRRASDPTGLSLSSSSVAADIISPTPTFQSVPFPVVAKHAEASLATLQRITDYVTERYKLEAKYAKDRAKLKMLDVPHPTDTGQDGHDCLEALWQALSLLHDIDTAQVATRLDEMDRQERQPLVQLCEYMSRTMAQCRQEFRHLDKEVRTQEDMLAKSKTGLARLQERREDLARRIQHCRRLVGRSSDTAADTVDEGDDDEDNNDDDAHFRRAAAQHPEIHLIPSLERRFYEIEEEIKASRAAIAAHADALVQVVGRQDDAQGRWAQSLEATDTKRRAVLGSVAHLLVEAEARAKQRGLFQLDSVTQLLALLDTTQDQQRFIGQYSKHGPTPRRYMALKLLMDLEEKKKDPQQQQHTQKQGAPTKEPAEKDERQIVAGLLRRLFEEEAEVVEANDANHKAPPPRLPTDAPTPTRDGLDSYDWDHLAAARKDGLHAVESTVEERRRFFEGIFAGEKSSGRAAFLHALNQQRSRNTRLPRRGFDELVTLLSKFLVECERVHDTHDAKMAMMLSNTFFHHGPADGGGKEFASKYLHDHPLWTNGAFWNAAFLDELNGQLESTLELPFDAASWHDLDAEALGDAVLRVHNIIFAQAGALAHSMLEMGGQVHAAQDFVRRVSEIYGLGEEMTSTLLLHLARFPHQQQKEERKRETG